MSYCDTVIQLKIDFSLNSGPIQSHGAESGRAANKDDVDFTWEQEKEQRARPMSASVSWHCFFILTTLNPQNSYIPHLTHTQAKKRLEGSFGACFSYSTVERAHMVYSIINLEKIPEKCNTGGSVLLNYSTTGPQACPCPTVLPPPTISYLP